jgi:hypothetical protein
MAAIPENTGQYVDPRRDGDGVKGLGPAGEYQ